LNENKVEDLEREKVKERERMSKRGKKNKKESSTGPTMTRFLKEVTS
jgi:hypothetical protein